MESGPQHNGDSRRVFRDAPPAFDLGAQVIERALGDLYKPEVILACGVERIAPNRFRVSFRFPPYERTVTPLEHVSGNQMGEALLEGLYCAVTASLLHGEFPGGTISVDDFRRRRGDFILYSQAIRYRKMLKVGELGHLDISVGALSDVAFLREFKRLEFKVHGFLSGEVVCLLSDQLTGVRIPSRPTR